MQTRKAAHSYMCAHTHTHVLTYTHALTGATHPASRGELICACTCAMQSAARAADKLHNTTRHSGSSVPWKMSRLASSQHSAPHLMFPPPPTLSLFVLFSQCSLSFFRFFLIYYIPFFPFFVSFDILSILVTFLSARCPNFFFFFFNLLRSTWHHLLHLVHIWWDKLLTLWMETTLIMRVI